MKNKLGVFLTLVCLVCLEVAYQPKLADARPHLPNLPDLPDVDRPNPNVPDPNMPDAPNPDAPNVQDFLPGETMEEYMARTYPESSREIYEKQKIYDPDMKNIPDWDLDGLRDNHPKDRVYGVDLPDPDPDPDPDPILCRRRKKSRSRKLPRPRRPPTR